MIPLLPKQGTGEGVDSYRKVLAHHTKKRRRPMQKGSRRMKKWRPPMRKRRPPMKKSQRPMRKSQRYFIVEKAKTLVELGVTS